MCYYLSHGDNKTCVGAFPGNGNYQKECPYLGQHTYGIPCYTRETPEEGMKRAYEK